MPILKTEEEFGAEVREQLTEMATKLNKAILEAARQRSHGNRAADGFHIALAFLEDAVGVGKSVRDWELKSGANKPLKI